VLRGLFLAVTFAGRADGPAWELWALRAVIALFGWFLGWLSAIEGFRELRRRGKWVLPGATRRPWLAAAVYAAVIHLTAAALVVGFMAFITLVFGSTT